LSISVDHRTVEARRARFGARLLGFNSTAPDLRLMDDSLRSSLCSAEMGWGGVEPRGLRFARPLGSIRHAIFTAHRRLVVTRRV